MQFDLQLQFYHLSFIIYFIILSFILSLSFVLYFTWVEVYGI